MADICIVYARPSRSAAQHIHAILSRRFSVWWDRDIHSGDYRLEIEQQLAKAKCVIPLWCRVSRADSDVIDEAKFAQDRGIPILPVRIEDVTAPLGFGALHTIDLLNWSGAEEHPDTTTLLGSVERLLTAKPPLLVRPARLTFNGRGLKVPAFFRSVSSHETQLRPDAAVHALRLYGERALLVSAYDMAHEPNDAVQRIRTNLEACRSNGGLVLLDSGNYEAFRKSDKPWTVEMFHQALQETPHDIAFSFDDMEAHQDVDAALSSVAFAVTRDTAHARRPPIPIVHAPRTPDGRPRTDVIPETLGRIARELRPELIAIPERELGDGLISRARTVYACRRRLDELGFYVPLHLLGTGNPLSIAVLAAAGADSFDGLEWCRTVADHGTGRLYHFQQYDFFAWQSLEMAESAIVRAAVRDTSGVEFAGRVVFHNLEFFTQWMTALSETLSTGKVDRFLSERLPPDCMRLLESALPEVF